MEETMEINVGPDDLADGEMREVAVFKNQKVLLIKDQGKISAIGPKCSHFGAPLVKGNYSSGRVRCPWHGACFNAKTGDIEDFPGLDSIPVYGVVVRDDRVFVKIPKSASSTDSSPTLPTRRVKEMCRRVSSSTQCVLIVGGGGAAMAAAESLRQNGFQGRVVMATEEACPPYDRTKLSKALSSSPSSLLLRDADFLGSIDVEVLVGARVEKIEFASKTAFCGAGSQVQFSHLLLATGARPRRFRAPGIADDAAPPNVKYLRTPGNANAIADEAQGAHVVILGSGFIGMEVAAYLSDKAKSVTVISRSSVPLQNVVGKRIGEALMKLHKSKGVIIKTGATISMATTNASGRVTSVSLKSKEGPLGDLPLDILIVGAGVEPNSELLRPVESSGVTLNAAGYVAVDQFLRTSSPYVWAAGDVAEFPLPVVKGGRVSIGHWQMALKTGHVAGSNIAADANETECKQILDTVPFFWSMQYGKSLRYAGLAANGYDDVVIHGDLDNYKFAAFYVAKNESGDDHVVAASSMNWDPIVAKFADSLKRGRNIPADVIRENPEGFFE